MNVLVIGGTGFTGAFVVRTLLARNYSVTCLVRPTSNLEDFPTKNVKVIQGDMGNRLDLTTALAGKDALVYVASLGFGHADGVVSALQDSGVRRAVLVSTTAMFTQLNSVSKSVRVAAEKSITDSPLDYTILRPTMIYGTGKDRNMCRLIKYIQRWPIIPIFGNGQSLQQPIQVEDVANAIVNVLPNAETYREAYNISGAAPLTYNKVIDVVSSGLQKRILKLHVPYKPVAWMLRRAESIGIKLPIKAEQILRLNEDKAFSHEKAAEDFGFQSRDFETGIKSQIEEFMSSS